LDALPIGAEIEGEGPNGTFILDEKDIGPQVFIAGGIGITPFRSILKYIADKGLLIPVYLIYSNSIPEEAAFIKELTEWEKAHSNIKIAMTMSHMEESKEKWSGSTGRVDDVMLKKFLADWKLEAKNCMFWVCGPPPMIDAMEQVLGKMAIGSDKIRSEKFTGY
jgi:ferredoxin-NADP reductase